MRADAQAVKSAAQGRWREIYASHGIPHDHLDGKNHPCPRCGGTDRFRLIDAERGALFCNQCFSSKNGDGIAGLGWLEGLDFKGTLDVLRRELGLSDGSDAPRTQKAPLGREVARYPYLDESGAHLFDVVRFEPKDFRQQAADGAWKTSNLRKVPFQYPDLLEHKTLPIYVVEGEKDALTLAGLGCLATCNPGGAGKWKLLDPEAVKAAFQGRAVVLIPDNDPAGLKHAKEILESLKPLAASLRLLELHGEGVKDVTDWIGSLGEISSPKEELERMAGRLENLAKEPEKAKTLIEVRDTYLAPLDIKLREWAIEGLFLQKSFALLAGHQKGGKTSFALQAAIAMQLEQLFLGRKIRIQGPFAILECDGSQDNLYLDIQAIARGLGSSGEAPLKYGILHRRAFDLADTALRAALFEDLKRLEPRVFILDPFRKLMRGNDSSSQDVLPVTDFCQEVSERLGCLVLLTDHLKKALDTKNGSHDSPQAELIRGSSHKAASCDTVLLFNKDEKNGCTIVTMSDQRHAGVIPPFTIKMDGDPDDPNSPKKLVLAGVGDPQDMPGWPDPLTLEIWDYVARFPGRGFNAIDKAIDGNRKGKEMLIMKMEAKGYLTITPHGKGKQKDHFVTKQGRPQGVVPGGSGVVLEPLAQVVQTPKGSHTNSRRQESVDPGTSSGNHLQTELPFDPRTDF